MNIQTVIHILELKEFQSIDDLKRNFHALAHRYHPDKNSEAPQDEKFRQVLSAYKFALENFSDLCSAFGVKGQQDDEESVKSVIQNMDDIFEDIFGFSKSGRVLGYQEPQKLYVKLEEALLGKAVRQKMVAYIKCPDCSGIGAKRGAVAKVCPHCFGQGHIGIEKHQSTQRKPCPKCHGRGRKIERPCERCDGYGRLRREHLQEFNLPPGLKPGEIYTLDSFDVETNSRAEIFVEPHILRHPIFQIDNYDLLCEYHLDFAQHNQAIKLKLNTPLGEVLLTIPETARAGDVIFVKGAGTFGDTRGKTRGDLKVVLKNKKKSFWHKVFGG